ncbi:hypothetical protein BJF78_19725 [Pseudonocardia sp. CNS-139]|nr:hypothetical protein BJF78_19725 [Pseudonocardia sp. CNS-139]
MGQASKSHGDGACVELAAAGDRILVRDSKNPEGARLDFTLATAGDLVDAARRGELDHLVERMP